MAKGITPISAYRQAVVIAQQNKMIMELLQGIEQRDRIIAEWEKIVDKIKYQELYHSKN